MRTIEATIRVEAGGTIEVPAPADLPTGEYRVVLTLEAENDRMGGTVSDFPVDDYGPWPAQLTLRREDMYNDWGR